MKILATTIFILAILSSCGQTGGSAPNPNASAGSTGSGDSTVTCGSGGSVVNGVCWYYAADNQSCTALCATRGGYNAATLTYAGSAGSAANCLAVMDAIGAPGGAITSQGCGVAVGCVFDSATPGRFLCTSPATNAGDAYLGGRRACACNS